MVGFLRCRLRCIEMLLSFSIVLTHTVATAIYTGTSTIQMKFSSPTLMPTSSGVWSGFSLFPRYQKVNSEFCS